MTIGAAWIRNGAQGEELWLATDSRLSGDGNIWDECPKLLPLPRRDAVAGFSGSTAQAYPLLLQISNTISNYQPAIDGTLEFTRLIAHLERVANSLMAKIERDPLLRGDTEPVRPEFSSTGDALIIGGYSRLQGGLVIRALRYHPGEERWVFQRVRGRTNLGRGRVIHIFGDNRSTGRYFHLLKSLMGDRGILESAHSLNFEPLEALAFMLQLPFGTTRRLPAGHKPTTIGGAPQVYCVLPGAKSTAFAVLWKNEENESIYLQGRKILDYENLTSPLITFEDPGVKVHAADRWPSSVAPNREIDLLPFDLEP